MAQGRTLRLRFILDTSDPIGPVDFRALFQLADDYVTYVALREARTLLREMRVDDETTELALEAMRSTRQSGATVVSVERGSWLVELDLAALALVWIIGQLITPVLKTAWDGSRARQVIETAIQNVLFFGAKQEVEDKRLATPRIGNMHVTSVTVSAALEGDTPALDIHVNPTIIHQPTRTDKELIDDFVAKLQRKQ